MEDIEGRAALVVEEKDGRGALNEDMDDRGSLVGKCDWGIAGLVMYVENVGDVEVSKVNGFGYVS
jgi:hypothetical protein